MLHQPLVRDFMLRAFLVPSLVIAQSAIGGEQVSIDGQLSALAAAYNSDDWKVFGGIYSIDAIVIPPNQNEVEGRNAVVELWKSFKNSKISNLIFKTGHVEEFGIIGHQTGSYSMKVPDAHGDLVVGGRFLAVWQRDSDGTWQIRRFCWNIVPN